MEGKAPWYVENVRPKKHPELSTAPIVRIAEARRLVEGAEAPFDVVYFDADGHLDLKATHEAADAPTSPPGTASRTG